MKKIFILNLCAIIAQTSMFCDSHDFAPEYYETKSTETPTLAPNQKKRGKIEVFVGSMRSAKTAALVDTVQLCEFTGQTALAFKPKCDNRNILNLNIDPRTYIGSRKGRWIPCFPVDTCKEMESIIQTHDDKTPQNKPSVIAFDEAMFFSEALAFTSLICKLRKEGRHVVIASLDTDFTGQSFGATIKEVLVVADEVHKLKAVCANCKEYTYCLTQLKEQPTERSDSRIRIGDDIYEPRCINCHQCPKE